MLRKQGIGASTFAEALKALKCRSVDLQREGRCKFRAKAYLGAAWISSTSVTRKSALSNLIKLALPIYEKEKIATGHACGEKGCSKGCKNCKAVPQLP